MNDYKFKVSKRVRFDIKRWQSRGKTDLEIALILGKKQSFILKCLEQIELEDRHNDV